MRGVRYKPIGVIHSLFKRVEDTPVQPGAAEGVESTIEVSPEYASGLQDIDGFSHIVVIFHCHLSRGYSLLVKPHLDDQMRGVFATRSPNRPNPIGVSVLRLLSVDGSTLRVGNLDIVDGTPLLDLKPCMPAHDVTTPDRFGWMSERGRKQST